MFASPVIVGFDPRGGSDPAAGSPAWRGGSTAAASASAETPGAARRSALSLLMRDVQTAATIADELMAAADAGFMDEDDDGGGGESELDEDDLGLLEALDAAWGSPSSSVFSVATAATAASSGSCSRPIAIPSAATSYFKDAAQRAHLEKLNQKRQVSKAGRRSPATCSRLLSRLRNRLHSQESAAYSSRVDLRVPQLQLAARLRLPAAAYSGRPCCHAPAA